MLEQLLSSKFLSGPVITELNTYARVAASRLSLSSDALPPHYEDTAQFLHLYFDLMSVYSPFFVSMRLDEFGFARGISRPLSEGIRWACETILGD
jgi:hypothetical protein